ncbi:retinal cone rhodopsin-sensitive cGMP 3',5'-cyclic phosphodiesterase subunit gamma-like [Carassius carassius]|uniref:retinal cone rhodopsin-sensitive cGMP 3',5'-cyclic phosphodiesterase subunit gamma-like n=1 Tax=Carassius carassius TaxID=217509 RepID=UPI002868DBD9|nr:retinal cone rhodopsin-sensitive cGMP 3',5'-cyclic phosphodiesterase subunit gamma-like [Carassius carassius]
MGKCVLTESRILTPSTHVRQKQKSSRSSLIQWAVLAIGLVNMDVSKPKAISKVVIRATAPGTPHKGPPKFKQRSTRQFKSKPPKKGVIGFGEDIPGMEGLGTDFNVICPWEAYSHLELHELAQYGII